MNTDLQNSMRAESDGLGPISVPKTAYWGPSTQRAKNNFALSNSDYRGGALVGMGSGGVPMLKVKPLVGLFLVGLGRSCRLGPWRRGR